MKPHIVLIRMFVVLGFLAALAALFPKDGIKISENFTLRFARISEVFETKTTNYADISKLIDDDRISQSKENQYVKTKETSLLKTIIDNSPVDTALLKANILRIQFPDENHSVLDAFFRELMYNNSLVRILHYGDSQIEGDRYSSHLRKNLQQKFGGEGLGLIPAKEVNNKSPNFNFVAVSDGWQRFTLYGNPYNHQKNNKFGILMSYCRFADTVKKVSKNYNEWLSFTKTTSYNDFQDFSHLKIFYGNLSQKIDIQLFADNVLLSKKILKPTNFYETFHWKFDKPYNNIKLQISGNESPDIYALALDGERGVAVDNVPMRGSSGLEFTKSNSALYSEQFRQLNVKLLILQFGLNVAHDSTANLHYYEKVLYEQLMFIKGINPEISILVLGVTDMSKKLGEHYVTIASVEKLRDAQRRAAFKAGCCFWDTYTAMGGRNSMPSWVAAKPPLAEKDYTHINYNGARILARMLYQALMREYNLFKKDEIRK